MPLFKCSCRQISESDVVVGSPAPQEEAAPAESSPITSAAVAEGILVLDDSALAVALSFLDLQDVPTITYVCRHFHRVTHSATGDRLLWSSLLKTYCPPLHELFGSANRQYDEATAKRLSYVLVKNDHNRRRKLLKKKKKKKLANLAERMVTIDHIHRDLMRRHIEICASTYNQVMYLRRMELGPDGSVKDFADDYADYRPAPHPMVDSFGRMETLYREPASNISRYAILVEFQPRSMSMEEDGGVCFSNELCPPLLAFKMLPSDLQWKKCLDQFVFYRSTAIYEKDVSAYDGIQTLKDLIRVRASSRNHTFPCCIAVSKINLDTGSQKLLYRGEICIWRPSARIVPNTINFIVEPLPVRYDHGSFVFPHLQQSEMNLPKPNNELSKNHTFISCRPQISFSFDVSGCSRNIMTPDSAMVRHDDVFTSPLTATFSLAVLRMLSDKADLKPPTSPAVNEEELQNFLEAP